MKSLFFNLLLSQLCCGMLCVISGLANAQTIDFDELSLSPDSFVDGYGFTATAGSWSSQSVSFNTNQFGPGWSYSNVNDTSTAGFGNQWAAITGTDISGTGNYAIGNSFSPNGAYINLPTHRIVKSLLVSNTTYAALSMQSGDSFAKKFGGSTGNDEDFFKVTFTGFSAASATGSQTGAVDFFLADFRFADNSQDFIVDSWTPLNLEALGAAQSIGITFESSDVGEFGMNTPAFVAIDNLTLATAVPEPATAIVPCLIATLGMSRRRRI